MSTPWAPRKGTIDPQWFINSSSGLLSRFDSEVCGLEQIFDSEKSACLTQYNRVYLIQTSLWWLYSLGSLKILAPKMIPRNKVLESNQR